MRRLRDRIGGNRDRLLAVGGLLLVSLLWGSSFVVIKIAARGFGAMGIASYRVAIAALCLVILGFFRGEKIPGDKRTVVLLLLLSILGQIVPFLSLGMSGHLTSSQNSAMMMGGVPLFTLLIGRFFLPDEEWTWRKWTALAIGFGGVLVALTSATLGAPSSDGRLAGDLGGCLFELLAAAGYAAGAVLSRMASKEMSPLVACAFTMTASAVLLWGVRLWAGPVPVTADRGAWAAIILLGTVNTALAYALYFWLVKFAGATFASLNNYIVPLIGLLFGCLVLSEDVSPGAVGGLVMILLGVSLFSPSPRAGRVSGAADTGPR